MIFTALKVYNLRDFKCLLSFTAIFVAGLRSAKQKTWARRKRDQETSLCFKSNFGRIEEKSLALHCGLGWVSTSTSSTLMINYKFHLNFMLQKTFLAVVYVTPNIPERINIKTKYNFMIFMIFQLFHKSMNNAKYKFYSIMGSIKSH